jgi:hypothetical protein
MQRCSQIIGGFILLSLTGCAFLATDPKLVDSYHGANSETLLFFSDRSVVHTKRVEAKEERHFLGYYWNRKRSPHLFLFAGPDTSRFIGTSFQMNDDFSIVTVQWGDYHKPNPAWQTTYRKGLHTD